MRALTGMALLVVIALGVWASVAAAQQRTCYTQRLPNGNSITRCY